MNPMQFPGLGALLRLLGSLALAGSLAACGGDDGPKPVETEDSRTTTATLGVMGGQVTTTSSTGVRYTLMVPADALSADTRISVTPIRSMGDAPLGRGLRAAVRFAPSGLVFKTEATLRIEAPDAGSAAPIGRRTVGFSRSEDGRVIRLAVPTKSSGALTLPVFHFSDAGAADASDQEILELPTPPTASELLIEELNNQPYHEGGGFENDVASAELLRRLFTGTVMGALRAAAGGLNVSGALSGYAQWLHFVDLGGLTTADLLSGEIAEARPRVAALIRGEFDAIMNTCTASAAGANELTVVRLLLQRQRAVRMGVATAAEGLDPAATLARVNDCVRPLLDPISLPTPMTVGSAFSLDTRARLLMAARAQATLDAGFSYEFTVTSSEASLARGGRGFSDSNGRFTVVATPASTQAQFQVKACVVYPDGNTERPNVTDLCVSTTVPDRCSRIASGVFINSADAVAAAQDLLEANSSSVSIDASTTANLGAVTLPCLRKVVGAVQTLGTGGMSVLKMPRLTEIGGSLVIDALGFSQIEAPLLASARGINFSNLHGGMTGINLGPARLTDGLQIVRIDRANPPDLDTLFTGLDGMSVDFFGIDSSTSGVLCRSSVERLLSRIVVRNPNGLPTLAFLRAC
jgi:hypothetical protein